MFKTERKTIDFIQKNCSVFFLLAVLIIGCSMRIAGFHFLSRDARLYLLKWYDKIAVEGISRQVGNYNIPYQIMIYILTKLPLNPLTAYKALSCAFDLGLAGAGGIIIWLSSEKDKVYRGILAFTLIFCSPIVIFNSSFWAQCDSIYAFFGIIALFLLFCEKYTLSFIFLGLAFAFKLQAMFMLPFFLICYMCRKKFSILNILLIPVTVITVSLPGILAGRKIWDIVDIYVEQTNTYNRIYTNFPSVYSLIAKKKDYGNYQMLRQFAILLTLLILGCGLYLCLKKGEQIFYNKIIFCGIIMWCLYTCNLFLPNMHDRYAYILEIISILYCFITPAGIPLAVAVNLFSIFSYGAYLFKFRAIPLPVTALLSLITYIAFSFWLYRKIQREEAVH